MKDLVFTEKQKHEALVIYQRQRLALGAKVDKQIKTRTTGEIWNLILRDANTAIAKEFDNEFKKIENLVARRKIKSTIETLYDEGIYCNANEAATLLACNDDNTSIEREYKALGGKQKLLVLKDIDRAIEESDDEFEDDEVIDDDEV